MKKILLIILFSISIQAVAQTTINDGQKISGHWTKANSPYIIKGVATIPQNATLTIDAGVVVKLYTGNSNIRTLESFDLGTIIVNGTLIAKGVSGLPVVFTRVGNSGNWGVIVFHTTSKNSVLENCKIEYAGSVVNAINMVSLYGAVSLYESFAQISYCEISNNTATAISAIKSSPKITNNTIVKNGNVGIYCYNLSSPEISNNTISENGWQGVYANDSSKPTVINSIIWDNEKENNFGNGTVSYSVVEESNLNANATDAGQNIFAIDPLFNNSQKNDFSLKKESPCIRAGKNMVNLGAEDITNEIVVIDNNSEEYKIYYAAEIQNELDNSKLFKPKGEFETTTEYENRQKNATKLKNEILLKYQTKYEAIVSEKQKEEDKIRIQKIKDSYTEFEIDFVDIGTYNADNQTFLVTMIFTPPLSQNKNQFSQNISVPISEAKSLKENSKNIKTTASEQLLEDGITYDVFNINIIHPITGSVYPFGIQREPLHLDAVENAVITDEDLKGIPYITTNINFIEPSGNKLLDAEEKANLELTLKNEGEGSAINLKIKIESSLAFGITNDKEFNIPKIKAGETQKILIPIKADQTIKTGELTFNLTFEEKRGFPPAPFNITIGTQELKSPKLEFIEAGIIEQQGNKNNIIENGELIMATLLIQNKGQGIAKDVRTTIKINDDKILAIKTDEFPLEQYISKLEPGEAKKINFMFSVNWLYDGTDDLPIDIEIAEPKGQYGGTFSAGLKMKTQSLAVNEVKVDGVYSNDIDINDASLSIDVDKNIPVSSKKYENRYALIIGNENYSDYQQGLSPMSNVEFAIHDAQIFKQYANKTLGIPENNIIELYDGQKHEMERDIKAFVRLAELAGGKAELFVYYAGHGYPDENSKDAYIMPVNISGNDVTAGIKLADFYKDLAKHKTKRVTVFIDACFSGGGRNEGLVAARSGILLKPKENILKGEIIVFSASSGDQISLPYRKKHHGIFTYFLLKALQDSKGDITYGELADELIMKVQASSITVNKKEQNPKVNVSQQINDTWEKWNFKE